MRQTVTIVTFMLFCCTAAFAQGSGSSGDIGGKDATPGAVQAPNSSGVSTAGTKGAAVQSKKKKSKSGSTAN